MTSSNERQSSHPHRRYCARFTADSVPGPRIGLVGPPGVRDLTAAGIDRLDELLERVDLLEHLAARQRASLPERRLDQVRLLTPVDRQEVWAAGVTYLRSKEARIEESDGGGRVYDHVYGAERPELFFKSLRSGSSGRRRQFASGRTHVGRCRSRRSLW